MTGGKTASSDDGEKLSELGHLAAAVGHHVINAFSAIVSNAELIRSRADDACEPSELDMLGTAIVDASLDASQVARRLIDWSRRATAVECDQTGKEPLLVDLNQLIRETVESEKTREGAQVDWVVNLGSISPIPGDAAGLGRMLGYLLRNAREALPGGAGTVAVSTFTDPRNWLIVTLRDSGCGMSPDLLKRATEPFFSTKPDQSGVGLTIAQAIWRRHRGALSIDSRPGQGTTIRLSIGPIA